MKTSSVSHLTRPSRSVSFFHGAVNFVKNRRLMQTCSKRLIFIIDKQKCDRIKPLHLPSRLDLGAPSNALACIVHALISLYLVAVGSQ